MIKIAAVVLIFLSVAATAGAYVFETAESGSAGFMPGIKASSLNSASLRINGQDVKIKRYESREPVKKVLEAILLDAEKNKMFTVNSPYIWLAANALFKGAGSGIDADKFGYIFTRAKNGKMAFVVAGSEGETTEIIKADIDTAGTTAGYDDGLCHFPGIKHMLSVELVSRGRTINFGNFYSIKGAGREEIFKYYADEFAKKGMKVLKTGNSANGAHYVLKGKEGECSISFNEAEDGETIVLIMG